jgi:hypothetical protein
MSLSNAPKVSDLDELKKKFKEADKDQSGALNRRGYTFIYFFSSFFT